MSTGDATGDRAGSHQMDPAEARTSAEAARARTSVHCHPQGPDEWFGEPGPDHLTNFNGFDRVNGGAGDGSYLATFDQAGGETGRLAPGPVRRGPTPRPGRGGRGRGRRSARRNRVSGPGPCRHPAASAATGRMRTTALPASLHPDRNLMGFHRSFRQCGGPSFPSSPDS